MGLLYQPKTPKLEIRRRKTLTKSRKASYIGSSYLKKWCSMLEKCNFGFFHSFLYTTKYFSGQKLSVENSYFNSDSMKKSSECHYYKESELWKIEMNEISVTKAQNVWVSSSLSTRESSRKEEED